MVVPHPHLGDHSLTETPCTAHRPQSNLTKVVVMDSTGGDKARALARALASLGYQLSYVMAGGFRAWAAAELPVVEGVVEYDASTGARISDELEVIAGKANEVVATVAQPQVRLCRGRGAGWLARSCGALQGLTG
eukprot:GHRQ01028552.1.p3 GENE.GHRQ01028552.1~~GHRQ01028552.1.p3  ORF type:complete len:135 (+),score=28.91 GHRQ01028552.1:231-635(+)